MKILVSALDPSSNLHLKEVLKHTQDVKLIAIIDSRQNLDELLLQKVLSL